MLIAQKNKIVIVFIGFSLYLIFSLISLQKTTHENISTAEKVINHKHITINQLKEKFDAEEFNGNIQSIIGKNIIIDTTLIGFYKINDAYYLKGKINLEQKEKYFVKLKCDKKFYNLATKSKTNHLIIALNVEKVNKSKMFLRIDSLDGEKEFSDGNYFLINGKCLSLFESKYL